MVEKQKVVAYITRLNNGVREVLVNVHRDFPEAGVQVPAGTVDPGEDLEAALIREVEEEAGLGRDDLALVRKLTVYTYFREDRNEYHRRHVYHLEAARELPDEWVHEDHFAEGETVVLNYYWTPLAEASCGGHQDDYFYLIEGEEVELPVRLTDMHRDALRELAERDGISVQQAAEAAVRVLAQKYEFLEETGVGYSFFYPETMNGIEPNFTLRVSKKLFAKAKRTYEVFLWQYLESSEQALELADRMRSQQKQH